MLGGTIKIIEIFKTETKENEIIKSLKEKLSENKSTGKINFAINIYGEKKKSFLQKRLLLDLKQEFKKQGKSCRFANKDFNNIVTATTIKEKLIKSETEFNIIFGENEIFIGKTVAIQDIDAYCERDYGRPCRDIQSGMMPPKLAQIMINLSRGTMHRVPTVIFDPFCGSGTILMEALLMGLPVIGCDISEKAIKDSKKNIQWLKEIFQINPDISCEIFQKDATTIKNSFLNPKPYTLYPNIITEPYLGPPLKKIPSDNEIKIIQREIEDILLAFFKNLSKNLPDVKNIIIIFPYIRTYRKKYYLQILSAIEKIGYKAEPLIPENLKQTFNIETNKRNSILYEREDQFVGREIFKFKPIDF